MNATVTAFLLLFIATALPVAATAGAVPVTDFRVIKDGFYYPLPASTTSGRRDWNLGPVTITSPAPSILGGVFAFDVDLTGPDPSGPVRLGYTDGFAPAVFNLSSPVAALGVSFSFIAPRTDAILRTYTGANATGDLVGMMRSVAIPAPWSANNRTIDFVAVWSDETNIRSFVLDGPESGQGASFTGYGVSFTPIPEPASASLMVFVMFACMKHYACQRRNR